MNRTLFLIFFFQSFFFFSQENKLNGMFENTSENIIQLLDRKLLKDTLSNSKIKNFSKFSIKIIDKNKLAITLINDIDSSKIERIYKYRLKNNSYFLKNKNTKPLLIPYIAGAIDTRKLFLSLDANNNLNIRTIETRSGAVLLIGFLDSKTKNNTYVYKRTE